MNRLRRTRGDVCSAVSRTISQLDDLIQNPDTTELDLRLPLDYLIQKQTSLADLDRHILTSTSDDDYFENKIQGAEDYRYFFYFMCGGALLVLHSRYPPLKHMPPPPCLVNQHEITFTKKEGCTLSTCLCVTLAVIFVTLGAAAGIYYGIQFLEGQRSIERVYKGSFTVLEGDRFSENLANSLTDDFLMKAEYYRAKLDQLFNTSAYQSGFKKVEVIAFNKRQHRELTVHFNVHFALNRKSVDAGDLYFVFTDEVLRSKLGIFDGLKIDPESIIVQERRLMADPLAESWTPKRQYPGYLAGLTTQQPAVIPPRLCEPLSIDHCRGLPYNLTSYPNAVGHNGPKEVYRDLVAYRQLVDSECYPLAAEFVCQLLQPECVDDEMLLPCRDFCEEFWSACRKLLPKSLSGKIDCSNYPQYDGNGSCRNKPGCANELKARGKTVRVCDGVVDCPDFSDETSCAVPHDMVLKLVEAELPADLE
ncbi:hypothetical protein HPB47_004166 [Ixodes persulcatus]|uniref:Uncharacterized protein n=1 Tax=Ixodes persulcatus TaxID=34615 RepID=A0AC60PI28_IXOPE|nr:hypothetical protein HPB47_004166 [Ixodes persulcatus]